MMIQKHGLLVMLALTLILTGCYNKPVRHLASDIALLKIGESTEEDVIIFLGEPDEQKEYGDNVSKWLYQDKEKSLLRSTPLIGEKIGTSAVRRAVVTLENGIVVDTRYTLSENDDLDWADDYSRQADKK